MTCNCLPQSGLSDAMFDALVTHLESKRDEAKAAFEVSNPQATLPPPCAIKPIPQDATDAEKACYYLATLQMLWRLIGCYDLPPQDAAQCITDTCSDYDDDWEQCEEAGD